MIDIPTELSGFQTLTALCLLNLEIHLKKAKLPKTNGAN